MLILIALAILVLAIVTRRALRESIALFVLMIVQNLLAGLGEDTPVLGALHGLNALVVTGLAAVLLMRLRPERASGQTSPRA